MSTCHKEYCATTQRSQRCLETLFEVMMASFAWTAFMATLQTVVDAGRAKTPAQQ